MPDGSSGLLSEDALALDLFLLLRMPPQQSGRLHASTGIKACRSANINKISLSDPRRLLPDVQA